MESPAGVVRASLLGPCVRALSSRSRSCFSPEVVRAWRVRRASLVLAVLGSCAPTLLGNRRLACCPGVMSAWHVMRASLVLVLLRSCVRTLPVTGRSEQQQQCCCCTTAAVLFVHSSNKEGVPLTLPPLLAVDLQQQPYRYLEKQQCC